MIMMSYLQVWKWLMFTVEIVSFLTKPSLTYSALQLLQNRFLSSESVSDPYAPQGKNLTCSN